VKTVWIVLISVVATAMIAGSGSYFYINHKAETAKNDLQAQINDLSVKLADVSDNSNNTLVAVANTNQNTNTDPTDGWKTFTDSNYATTLKYPSTLPVPTLSVVKMGAQDIFPNINWDNIKFPVQVAEQSYGTSVNISTLAEYKNSSAYVQSYNQIMSVYNNKNASGASKLLMPPENAQITASSSPTYIENTNGEYRGIYYFANIGQDYSTDLALIAILTNNKNVVELNVTMNSDKSAQYTSTLGKDSTFPSYVANLNSSSDETIANEFLSTYQYLIKSIK